MTHRYDVSSVPLQGGYIAKWNVIKPVEPAPDPEPAILRMQAGVAFEADVLGELEPALDGRWVVIPSDAPREEAVRLTVEAMEASAEVIVGGWLPVDTRGRRVGKPDMLVWDEDGYAPVDVKHHLALTEADETARVSSIDAPFPAVSQEQSGVMLRKHKGDALQLAHYRRMLEACGHAASSWWAGILGKEGVVVWYDLDEPMWITPAKSDGKKQKKRTSMEVYDFEFDFRLDIAAVADLHRNDPSVGLLVQPISCDECGECPWRDYCGPIYRAGTGDPSLLPWVGYPQWRALQGAGVVDRAGVAALDYETARMVAEDDRVADVLEKALESPPHTPIDAIATSKKVRRLLDEAGIHTAGDAVRVLDPTTAHVGGGFLPAAIVEARAVLGPEPIYRRPGASVYVPRFDVEIDLDMENGIQDEVYLWGAHVRDRSGSSVVDSGYQAFVDWGSDPAEVEQAAVRAFWEWFIDLVATVEDEGLSLGVFSWSGAEARRLIRVAAGDAELEEAAEELIASESWVDLMAVFKEGWTTGQGNSVKSVAGAIGFLWAVDDPDGAMSMVRHAEAVAGDEAAREWLLTYNQSDVEATLAVREWLDGPGGRVPEVPTGPWPG